MLHTYLARTEETNKLAASYLRFFSERLDRFPLNEPSTVRIYDFLCKDMAESAIASLMGTRIFELNPDLLERLWDFDSIVGTIAWGPPKWIKRGAWRSRERFHATCAKYLKAAWDEFDWNGPDADADWEPIFGARFSRELAKWIKECDFDLETAAGIVSVTSIFGYSQLSP